MYCTTVQLHQRVLQIAMPLHTGAWRRDQRDSPYPGDPLASVPQMGGRRRLNEATHQPGAEAALRLCAARCAQATWPRDSSHTKTHLPARHTCKRSGQEVALRGVLAFQ